MKNDANHNWVIPMDLPMPLSFYADNGIASRSTIWHWENEGLRVIRSRKGGRAYIRPADMRDFLMSGDTTTPIDGGGATVKAATQAI